ncbi:MAG: prepilin-type N-terminal cleavage/methylation domain-containing protein [Chlamydiales bacterium]
MKIHVHSARRVCNGFTLVELLVVMTIMTIALGEVTRSMLTISRLEPISRESDLALQAAATQLDTMRAQSFEELYSLYNDDAADDPDGPDTAPGRSFAVTGLGVRLDDIDGMTGRIELPLVGTELREDFDDVELGMPRDLNMDGATDALDHSGDYAVLPVRVLVEWSSDGRDRQVQLMTTMTTGD